jgi:hypothetical protein
LYNYIDKYKNKYRENERVQKYAEAWGNKYYKGNSEGSRENNNFTLASLYIRKILFGKD